MAKRKPAGDAQVTLSLDDSPLARGLRMAQGKMIAWGRSIERITGRIGGSLQNIGRGISSLGAKLTGFGASALAAFAYPLKAASDLEETMSKFNTVFGDSAGDVQKWGDELAAQIGRGKTQIRQFLAANQDLLVPIGFDAKAAEDTSKIITQLTFDLASFNNMADADVHRDLQAALTGSGEVMKKYGVIVSAAATKQELLAQGLDPKAATEAQKAQARLNIILRGTTAAQGDALRTSGSFANQMKALRARLADTAAVVGSKLLPVVTPLITKAGELAERFGAWAAANGPAIVAALKLAAGVAAVGVALTVLGPIITAAGTAIIAAGVAVGGLVATVGTLIGIMAALATPMGVITAGIVALTASAVTSQGAVDTLGKTFTGLKETAVEAWGGIMDALKAGDIKGAVAIAGAGMKVAWAQALIGVRSLWIDTKNFLLSVWDQATANIAKAMIGTMGRVVKAFHAAALMVKRLQLKLGGASDEALKAFDFAAGIDKAAMASMIKTTIGGVDDQTEAKAAARQAAKEKELAGAEADLAKAKQELRDVIKSTAAKNNIPPPPPTAENAESGSGSGASGAMAGTAADVGGGASGTFSAFAVRGLAGNSVAERTAKATEQTSANTKEIRDEIRAGQPAFGA